jgi:hypothetical protein
MPANKYDGEVEIELGGRTFTMRPSFEFIQILESLTGRGAWPILKGFEKEDFKTTEIAMAVYAGCRAGGDKNLTLEKVGELIRGRRAFAAAARGAVDLIRNYHAADDGEPNPTKSKTVKAQKTTAE